MKIGFSSNLGPASFYLVRNSAQLPLVLLLVALFAGVRDTKVVWLDEFVLRLRKIFLGPWKRASLDVTKTVPQA